MPGKSVGKQWDIQSVKKTPTPSPEPVPPTPSRPSRVLIRQKRLARAKSVIEAKEPIVPSPRKAKLPSKPLKARRRVARRRTRIALGIFFVLLIAGLFFALWRPALRVENVSVEGPHADEVQTLAQNVFSGTYAYIVPRNSIFFLPIPQLRKAVLATYPDIDAVGSTRTSFQTITVMTTERATAFEWCGESVDHPSETCIAADAEGLLFASTTHSLAPETPLNASSTPVVRAPLTNGVLQLFSARTGMASSSPIRNYVASANRIPPLLEFVKAIKRLNVPVTTVAIQGDEADIWITPQTRITYVLGHEAQAVRLATAALPGLQLLDGSIQYVDLRFAGRVYVLRRGEVAPEAQ